MRAPKGKSVQNEFGGGAAPAKSSSKKSSSSLISIFMWILNLGILVAAYFALSNWTAINWMTGSYGWAALLEIGALLLLLFLLLSGICLFGWSTRIESSFSTLADSPQLLYLFALAMPFLIVSFFGTLTLLSLTNINATNMFVATHAEAVYKQAAAYATDGGASGIDRKAFAMHICSLPSFRDQCGWLDFSVPGTVKEKPGTDPKKFPFYIEISNIFDIMCNFNQNPTGLLTVADIYRGVKLALKPYKQKFGWSVLSITIICLIQFAYYGYKFLQYQKTAKKAEMEKEQLSFA